MRPIYETDDDLSREARFAAIISDSFKCKLHKMPIRYGLDFAAIKDGRTIGFLETKIRMNPVEKYPTYMISLGKFMSAEAITRATSLSCRLAVMWTNGWGFVKMEMTPDVVVSVGGRRDRGDDQDVEPVCLIPISSFTICHLRDGN